MSTISLSGVDFTVVYVDPSIASSGDGSTPATALQNLPTFENLQNKRAYLIRRLGGSGEVTFPTGTSSTDSLNYVFMGMPKTADPLYEMVPAEAKTAWGSDSQSEDYVYAYMGTSGFKLAGNSIIFLSSRIYFYHKNLSSSSISYMLNLSSNNFTNLVSFTNCRFGYLGYELDQTSVSVETSEISTSKRIYYEETEDTGNISCKGKYFLLSGTHGEQNAVYKNLLTNMKIHYENEYEEDMWAMSEDISGGNYQYCVSSSITGSWYPWNAEPPDPVVVESSEILQFKVRIVDGLDGVSGDYFIESGTHGETSAIYSNGTYSLEYDSDQSVWVLKKNEVVEYVGTSNLYGTFSKGAHWDSVPRYGMDGYIFCGENGTGGPLSFEMRECVVNCLYQKSMSMKIPVRLNDKRVCSISNNKFNIVLSNTTSYSQASTYALHLSGSIYNYSYDCGRYTRISCLEFTLYKYSTSSSGVINYIPGLVYDSSSSFLEIKGITVNMPVDLKIGSEQPTTIAQSLGDNGFLSFREEREFDIDGIEMDLPQFWKMETNRNSLLLLTGENYSYGSDNSSVPGSFHSIKNVSLSCAQGSGEGTYDGLDDSSPTGDYWSQIGNTDFSAPSCCLRIINNLNEQWNLSNISLSHPHGMALEAAGVWFEAETISGAIRGASSAVVVINSLSTWYAGRAIAAYSGSNIKVQTLTCGTGGSATPNDEFVLLVEPYTQKSFIYIGTSNRQLLTDSRTSSADYSNTYSAICANEKFTGRYTLRTENYLCMTYGTFRTTPPAQVQATLKLQNMWCNSAYSSLELGQAPFGGFKLTPTSIGKKILYIYGAASDFGLTREEIKGEIGKNVLVEVVVPTSTGGKRSVLSTSGSWMLDDYSVWSDSNISYSDPDATGYPVKLKLPLEIETTSSPIEIKVHYKWYSPNGAFFLDPFFDLSNP